MNQKPLFLAVTLVALLVIGGAFWVMQKRQVTVNQSVITEPVVETSDQTESEKYPQHIEAIPGNTDEVWYNIPELGVRMKLNREFASDLVYSYSKSNENITKDQQKFTTPFHETVHFSSRSLMQQEPACEPGTRAIGYFIKEEGAAEEWPASASIFYAGRKQFSNFFIVLGISNNEDNTKVPMCMLSETSKWTLLHTSEDEIKNIEHFVQDQSGLLRKGFNGLEISHQSNQ
jgi:hypothetical protein